MDKQNQYIGKQEVRDLIEVNRELVEALEAFLFACEKAPPIEFISYIGRAVEKARPILAKAKGVL